MCQVGVNLLQAHIKLQSNGPLYSNTVIDTLSADWWAVTFGTVQAAAPPSPLLAVPNETAHLSMASVPTSYYLMRHYNSGAPVVLKFLKI